jgi:hypothetical protein
MAIFKKDEIMAYSVGGDVVCLDCVSDDEIDAESIITEFQDDELVFCDRCKEKISG